MRIVIFANGQLHQPIAINPDDLIIAADGGASHCLKLNLHPAILIGDLDSLNDEQLSVLKAGGTEIIEFPKRKDYTDFELALRYAQDLGASEILVLGALGERWDQTIANILLPTLFSSTRVILTDGSQEILFVRGGERLKVRGNPGDTLSLIPLIGNARGITTHNLEYPLSEGDLVFGSTRGISNELIGKTATISLREGLLLCIVIHKSS